ncbi:MAG: class I SAM-dependent methyltransferase [Bacteroidota bacterium]
MDWKRKYWQQFLEKNEIDLSPGQHILDVGCGPAGVYMLLDQQKVVAVDPLLDRYASSLDHFDRQFYPWVQFNPIPFEAFVIDQQYDKVFCLNAINHVADLEFCFDHLVKACRPGGELIVSIDAHNYELCKHLFRWIPGDILHPHQYNLQEYEQMLSNRHCSRQRTNLYKQEFFFNYYVLIARKGLKSGDASI